MMAKDFRNLLQKGSQAARQDAQSTLSRFDVAERALEGRPGGLLSASAEPSFRAETAHSDAEGGEFEVALDLLLDNPYGARSIYVESDIRERAASISTMGQLEAIKVIHSQDRPGFFVIADGGTRKRAMALLNRTTIRAKLVKADTPRELHRVSMTLNKERSDGTPLDHALVWQKMLDDNVASDQDDLATLSGVVKGTVSKALAMLRLRADLISLIRERPHDMSAYFGYELYLLQKAVEQRGGEAVAKIDLAEVTLKIMDGQLSAAAIQKMRDNLESRKERKTRESSRQYKVEGGLLKEWDNGTVSLNVVVQDPEERARLVAELKAKFAPQTKPE